MTDETFLARFEAASLHRFDHRDHLRVAFAYARRGGIEHAVARAREGLRHFAAAHGEPGRYHETLTTAWARVVGHYALQAPATTTSTPSSPPIRGCSSATCSAPTTAASGCSARRRGRPSSSPTCWRCPEGQRQPPAIAGRMTSTSPSPTGVSSPSSTRTSSSLR